MARRSVKGASAARTPYSLFFSTDQTMEVGCDVGEPVSPDYGARDNEFSGKHQMGADRYRRRRSRMPTT